MLINLMKKILAMIGLVGLLFSSGVEAADMRDVIYADVYSNNPNQAEAQWITDAILYASSVYQVDPLLVTAVMESESSFDMASMSPVGAIGLMQLMPETADSVGVNPYDPLGNVIGGTAHLRDLLNTFNNGDPYGVTYAVAAYNAGSGAVRQYGGCPPYAETIQYVHNVSDAYNKLLAWLNS